VDYRGEKNFYFYLYATDSLHRLSATDQFSHHLHAKLLSHYHIYCIYMIRIVSFLFSSFELCLYWYFLHLTVMVRCIL